MKSWRTRSEERVQADLGSDYCGSRSENAAGKEAFESIIDNEQNSFVHNNINELAETTTFKCKGVILKTVLNFIGNIKQYYIQDINA